MIEDTALNNFLVPFFSEINRKEFIKRCLRERKTQRMLLLAQWYAEIADGQNVVKKNRPALQIIFLISLVEGVARVRNNCLSDDSRRSTKMIEEFFELIAREDKKTLLQNFKRAFVSGKYHKLRFSSIVNILCDICMDISLTYKELRAIIIRTALENIRRAGRGFRV